MIVKVKKINSSVVLPEYKTPLSAGADVYAFLEEPVSIEPHTTALIPTGLIMEIPEGYEVQLRPRSGLALNKGLTLLNTPGTIDADYRGEVKVILHNTSSSVVKIENGERIAQAVLAPVIRAEWQVTEELNSTLRGTGGFGSTGV